MSDRNAMARIDQQASDWFVELQSETVSAAQRARFEAWLAADPEHAHSYAQTRAAWSELGALRAWAETEILPDAADGLLARCRSFLMQRPLALSAAGLLTLCGAIGLAILLVGAQLRTQGHETRTAEIREVKLPDGSRVTLGARSAIDIHFNADERRVLLTKGEAFFAVEKNSTRPFVVVANDTRVRVVGTKFNVHCDPRKIRVAVKEGVVEVTHAQHRPDSSGMSDSPEWLDDRSPTPSGSKTYILNAGQKVVTERGSADSTIDAIGSDNVDAWRSGRLVYENASLEEVIGDAGRYFDGRIEFSRPALKELRVTASFQTDEIEHLLDTLVLALPVEIERRAGHILLKPRS